LIWIPGARQGSVNYLATNPMMHFPASKIG